MHVHSDTPHVITHAPHPLRTLDGTPNTIRDCKPLRVHMFVARAGAETGLKHTGRLQELSSTCSSLEPARKRC
eukprot:5787714-Alexandrium_andersonii.AAC.1